MDKKIIIPELLSPAGGPASLLAAVENRCDAVYLGGAQYGARASAENFAGEALWRALDYAHVRGVRVYITVNTLYRDDELSGLFRFAEEAYRRGADAFIMQDIGAAMFLKRELPLIPLHASTQMTAHCADDVLFLRDAGFTRVVPAREASFTDLTEICAVSGMECEVFVHGALCVGYSGQCLFSSMIGGRSGNRGRCAQPCRRYYTLEPTGAAGYLLSPKDLMTRHLLSQIVETGVAALKIEGRMRNPEYVALTTRLYRETLDEIAYGHPQVLDADETEKLAAVFSRGGTFTDGYFNTHSESGMMSVNVPKATGTRIGVVTGVDHSDNLGGRRRNPANGARADGPFGRVRIRLDKPLSAGDGIMIAGTAAQQMNEPAFSGCKIDKMAAVGTTVTIEMSTRETARIQKGDAVYRSFDKSLTDEIQKTYARDTRRQTLDGRAVIHAGESAVLTLGLDEVTVTVTGATAQRAVSKPVMPEEFITRLEKTGGESFSLKIAGEGTQIDSGLFMAVKDINELRRRGVAAFEEAYVQSFRRATGHESSMDETHNAGNIHNTSVFINNTPEESVESVASHVLKKVITVSVTTAAQFKGAVEAGASIIYFEMERENIMFIQSNRAALRGIKLYASLPRLHGCADILNTGRISEFPYSQTRREGRGGVEAFDDTILSGYLARTWGQLYRLRSGGHTVIADYTLNTMNSLSYLCLTKYAARVTFSPELSLAQLRTSGNDGLNQEVIVYGRMPLMVTRQCPVGLYEAGKDKNQFCRLKGKTAGYALKDQTGKTFPLLTNCEQCLCLLLNADTTDMRGREKDLLSLPQRWLRLMFTTETQDETRAVVTAYRLALDDNDGGLSDLPDIIGPAASTLPQKITRGHFYRGVL